MRGTVLPRTRTKSLNYPAGSGDMSPARAVARWPQITPPLLTQPMKKATDVSLARKTMPAYQERPRVGSRQRRIPCKIPYALRVLTSPRRYLQLQGEATQDSSEIC